MAPGTRTVRIMHLVRASGCEVHGGTNLAPECLRMDGIARLPSPAVAPPCPLGFVACRRRVCASGGTQRRRARAQSTGARAGGERARAREVTSHEEVPSLSFPPYFPGSTVPAVSLSLSLSPSLSHGALFQLLVVGGALHAPLALSPFYIKETPVLARIGKVTRDQTREGFAYCVRIGPWPCVTKRNFSPRHTRSSGEKKRRTASRDFSRRRPRRSRDYALKRDDRKGVAPEAARFISGVSSPKSSAQVCLPRPSRRKASAPSLRPPPLSSLFDSLLRRVARPDIPYGRD